MNIFTVTALVPVSDEGAGDTYIEVLHYVDAMHIQEAQDIVRGISGVTIEKIVSASLLTDKVWKRSDVKAKKGNA